MQFRSWPIVVFFVSLSVVGSSVPALCAEESSRRVAQNDSDGFVSIFDGRTLDGWHAVPKDCVSDWTVREGTIIGHGSADRLAYLVWKDEHLTDFELELRYRLESKGNTGIEIRSQPDRTGKRPFEGYHADLGHVGIGPHILGAWDFHFAKRKEYPCKRGTRLVIDEDGKAHSSKIPGALTLADVRSRQWNDVRIIARGNHFQFFINGKLASEFTDNAKRGRLDYGAIGLQIHDKGMDVEFKDLRLKRYNAVDQLRLTPQWRAGRDLSAIKGKVIRLKFHLRNAKLYSFRVAVGGAVVNETIEVNGLAVTLGALPDGLAIPAGTSSDGPFCE